MYPTDNESGLDDYQRYVLEGLYEQKARELGRALTLGERRTLRDDYIASIQNAKPAKKRSHKRHFSIVDEKTFEWKPSRSTRFIRSRG